MIEDAGSAKDADGSGARTGRATIAGYGIMPGRPSGGMRRGVRQAAPGANFVVLWAVVSGLWTIATVLRIRRVWLTDRDWAGILGSEFTWISLLLPPLMFAIVLIAMSRVASAHHGRGR